MSFKPTILRILMCCFFMSLFFFLFQHNTYAQQPNAIVKGTVTDQYTGEPLAGATVSLVVGESVKTTATQADGSYRFQDVPVVRVSLHVERMAYSSYYVSNVLVRSGRETVLNAALESRAILLEESIVSEDVSKCLTLNRMATASARIFSSEEANRYAGSWGDPARMVSNLAGVGAVDDNRNDIVIRGNSPTGVLWRLDGFEIPNPNHFAVLGGTGSAVSILNNNQLANSDFYTGAFPAEFGNALAGVFDLKLRTGNSERHEFLAGVGINGFEFGAEGPLSKKMKASYMVNARYSALDLVDRLRIDVGTGGAIPKYQDLTAKLHIPLEKGTITAIALMGNSAIHFETEFDDKPLVGDIAHDTRNGSKQVFAGVNFLRRLSTNTRLENRFSYQYFLTQTDLLEEVYPAKEQAPYFNDESSEGRISYVGTLYHRFNMRNMINVGLGADVFQSKLYSVYHGDGFPQVTHRSSLNTVMIKGFVQWLHRFSDRWHITPGVYTQGYTLNNNIGVDPRIGLKWNINRGLSLNAATGLHSQTQQRMVYLYRDAGSLVNKNLKMTRSWQQVVGLDLHIGRGMRFKPELYHQYLYNVPVTADEPAESILNIGDGFFNNWNYVFVNQGYGRNYGLDITVEKFFDKNYYFLFTGSLYNSAYRGYEQKWRQSRFSGNYALNFLGGYEWDVGKGILLAVNSKVTYRGGKRFVPASVRQTGHEPTYDYSHAYQKRLADYFRADLNFTMKQSFKRFSNEWFMEVNNLTNHKNVLTNQFNLSRSRYESTYQTGLSFMGGTRFYF